MLSDKKVSHDKGKKSEEVKEIKERSTTSSFLEAREHFSPCIVENLLFRCKEICP